MLRTRFTLLAIPVMILTSCSAPIHTCTSVSGDSEPLPVQQLNDYGIALPPLTGDIKKFNDVVTSSVRNWLYRDEILHFLDPEETARKLNQEDLVQFYRETINTYNETGIIDQKAAVKLGTALDTRYVMKVDLQDLRSKKRRAVSH
ncbi:MAG: hypothetical protein R3281_07485 [Balneolaceae bacterium]|nr:hypothetical protein [Balneolaceae bacterium]